MSPPDTVPEKKKVPSIFSAACALLNLAAYIGAELALRSVVDPVARAVIAAHTVETFGPWLVIAAVVCAVGAFVRRERFRWITLLVVLTFLGAFL